MLLIVGRWDRDRISRFRRTDRFSPADFDLLESHLRRYSGLVTTAPVLTEVSNLMGNDFHLRIAATIVDVCVAIRERGTPKDDVLSDEAFDRLGFADASIVRATAGHDGEPTVVLTDDATLYHEVLYRGGDAINFNHLRRYRD